MLKILSSLNEAQLKAATLLDEHSMVLSCPGSGKTKTVEAKVVNLLSSLPQSSVCCTTFSKAGALEIKQRAMAAAKGIHGLNKRLTVSTFHSLCYHTVKDSNKKHPNMISEGERKFHIRGAAMDMKMDLKSDLFDKACSAIDTYATLPKQKHDALPDIIHKVRSRYKERIKKAQKKDYEDLLIEAIDLLESGKAKPNPYTHIICDEAQDSDTLMYRWLMVYAKAGAVITLMLDDDQTLYSFRNSLGVQICHMLEEDLGAVTILNGTNYRSKEEVLEPARRLISKNLKRINKDIVAHRGEGGSFTTHHFQSQKDTILLLESLMTEKPEDWFILCRTNADIEQIATHLIEIGIPYEGPEGISLLEKPEVQAYIELLSTLYSGGGHGLDMTAIQCIATDKHIANLCKKNNCSTLLEALNKGLKQSDLAEFDTTQKNKLIDLTQKITVWKEAVEENRESRVVRLAGQWMENNYPKDPATIQAVMNMLLKKTSGIIPKRIQHLQRLLDKRETESAKAVKLMTGHSSKGLQRKNVLIWNCRDGSFPSIQKEDDDTPQSDFTEEERRILYVAMTRAEDNLHIVYQRNKVNAKRITPYKKSKFIADMDIDLGLPLGAPIKM